MGLCLCMECAGAMVNKEIDGYSNWHAGRTCLRVSSKLLVVIFLSLRHFLHSDDKDTSWWMSGNVFRNLATTLQQKDYQVELGIKVLLSRVANQTKNVSLRKILRNIEDQLYFSCLKVEEISLDYECDMAHLHNNNSDALTMMMQNFVCRFDYRFVNDNLLLPSKSSCPELRLSTAAADKSLSMSFEFSSEIVPGQGRDQAHSDQRLSGGSNNRSITIIPQVTSLIFLILILISWGRGGCTYMCVCDLDPDTAEVVTHNIE